MLKPNGVMKIEELTSKTLPNILVLFDGGLDKIVQVIADVLGKTSVIVASEKEMVVVSTASSDHAVVGLSNDLVTKPETITSFHGTVIAAHAIDIVDSWDEELSTLYDYEYLYFQNDFSRSDLVRFLGSVLGLTDAHASIRQKPQSTLLSLSVPDVCAAVPNLEIATVGVDAVELRVDLLDMPSKSLEFNQLANVKFVGEQVRRLRQATELPIVFAIRSQKSGGKFPVDDLTSLYTYLRKAIQWGCEYIEVESWLPEEIPCKLAGDKRNSKIISSFHDPSGKFRWCSEEAFELFKKGAVHGDVVKMSALATSVEDNLELENFRETVRSSGYRQPLSAFNFSTTGPPSQNSNKFLTPITHPILSPVQVTSELTIADVNMKLDVLEQRPSSQIYAVGNNVDISRTATFVQKCLNELSLSQQVRHLDSSSQFSLDAMTEQTSFGGAFINPGANASDLRNFNLTEAAKQIGQVELLLPKNGMSQTPTVGDNISWKAIRSTLTRSFVASAFEGKRALIVGDNSTITTCLASVFALKTLNIGSIHSIGFKMKGPLANDIQRLGGIEDLKQVTDPFVIISALPSIRATGVLPLLKFYSDDSNQSGFPGKLFLDLSRGVQSKKTTASALAAQLGWHIHDAEDVHSWTAVELMRLLSSQNIGFDFARKHI